MSLMVIGLAGSRDHVLGFELVAGAAEGGGDGPECVGRGADQESFVVDDHVLGSGVDGGLHHLVFAEIAVGEADFALAVELVGDAAGAGDAAEVLGEDFADAGRGSIEVVGGDLDQEGGAGGSVAFVGDVLDAFAAAFAGALPDGAVDVVLGHGDGPGAVDGGAQAGVHRRVTAAVAGRDGDFMSTLAEDLATFGVFLGLDVLDLGPLVMTCHGADGSGNAGRALPAWIANQRELRGGPGHRATEPVKLAPRFGRRGCLRGAEPNSGIRRLPPQRPNDGTVEATLRGCKPFFTR